MLLTEREDNESRSQAEEAARHFLTYNDLLLAIRIRSHAVLGTITWPSPSVRHTV